MFERLLKPKLSTLKKSVLLLGPRQTGKSTLIKSLQPDLSINLAHEPTYQSFLRNPAELEERMSAKAPKTVFVDEIQRIPSLTNTIQSILDEDPKIKFYLTGSSARKLKRGQANLLPGRVVAYSLHPFVGAELDFKIDEQKALRFGLLPGIYSEGDEDLCREVLQTYSSTYLKEEIQAEGLVRNMAGFSRFLPIAAAYSGSLLDFSKLSARAEIPRQSAVNFFEILKDTMIVREVFPFTQEDRRRYVQHPKFYFFDVGVLNGTLNNFAPSADRAGLLFETLLFNQLHDQLDYKRANFEISTFRTHSGIEVDFLLRLDGDLHAIEVKSATQLHSSDFSGLEQIENHVKVKEKWLLYRGKVEKKSGNIWILPWQTGLRRLSL